MQLRERLQSEMKEAMKSRNAVKLSVIRMVISAVKNRDIELRRELNDREITEAIVSLCKQRRESIRLYQEGNRQDLVDKEGAELAILLGFLPAQLDATEIATLASRIIREIGAVGVKDMGKVMKAIAPLTAGRADGKIVSDIVKEQLA